MSAEGATQNLVRTVKILPSLFFLPILALCAPPAGEDFWADSQKLLLLGVERLARNDGREGIPLLEAVLRLNPSSAPARAWLAHAFHIQRRLDEAAIHYQKLLAQEPAQRPDGRRREAMLRFAPRVYQVSTDPFPLIDAVAVHHPEEPLIAYHFFWQDDIDFPADNDPCDHELVWVRYDPASMELTDFYTYFHGRILHSPGSVKDAADHGGRPRVNVQWGKHGSLPHGWEDLSIQANLGDIERRYLNLSEPQSLRDYNAATFRKLSTEGREHRDHPRTSNWPVRFQGTWEDFTRFDKEVDLLPHLTAQNKMTVSRWNNAVLQQSFIAYNFRPKTEWPDRQDSPPSLSAQIDRRVGGSSESILTRSEAVTLRGEAGNQADPFAAALAEKFPGLPFDLPPMSLFLPETPRYPNLWIYSPLERFKTYDSFIRFLESRFRGAGYGSEEVSLNEGADLVFAVEHLQPWNAVQGLRHAHAVHIRFFWRKLEREKLHRSVLGESAGRKEFWRVAASVHYEVEHAHPLHADVEVCPHCGRTGAYSPREGNLVEQVHDPLGVELLLRGRIRGEEVRTLDNRRFPALGDFLAVRADDVHVTAPYRGEMNTAAISAIILRSSR